MFEDTQFHVSHAELHPCSFFVFFLFHVENAGDGSYSISKGIVPVNVVNMYSLDTFDGIHVNILFEM